MNRKKILWNLLLSLSVFLALAFGAEWSVRLLRPDIQPRGTDRQLIADSLYKDSAGLRPGSRGNSNGKRIHVNRYGCRSFSRKIVSGKKSWLLLGDSVTLGIGVEADSTFAGRLQAARDSLNILNPSLIGYNARDYRHVLEHFVVSNPFQFTYRRVTLCWCLNDICPHAGDIRAPGGYLRSAIPDLLAELRSHSRLYLFMKGILFDRPAAYFRFDRRYYEPDDEHFNRAIHCIAEMDRICRERHIPFDIVLLPYEYQLRPGNRHELSPQSILSTALKRMSDVPISDLTGNLTGSGDPRKLYLWGDGIHFSIHGHRLIAEGICDLELSPGN